MITAEDTLARVCDEREALRAENERLRAELIRANRGRAENGEACDGYAERLATANALLDAIRGYMHSTLADSSFAVKGFAAQRVRDLLAAQPATSPPVRCAAHDAPIVNEAFFSCGCRYVQPARGRTP